MTETPLADIRPLYGFVDPHGGSADAKSGRLKRIASQAAICVGGMDTMGRIFVVDAWAGRVSTDTLIDRMYETTDRWNLKLLGGEASGLQSLFQDAVIRDARLRGKRLPLIKVIQPTHQQKDYRIRTTLQPLVGNGRLFIRADLIELVAQFTAFPLSPQKDLIDCTASLCRLMPPRPTRFERDTELEAKLKYLRDRGADPQLIAEVATGGRHGHRLSA